MKSKNHSNAVAEESTVMVVAKTGIHQTRQISACMVPALAATYCALLFYSQIADKSFLHFAYMGYLSSFACGFLSSPLIKQDESFCELRMLVDYAQLMLPITCMTTELWLHYDIAPKEICILPAAFGIAAVLFYIILEYKRQDITDLTLFLSVGVMVAVGSYEENYLAVGAAMEFFGYYCRVKRREECPLKNQELFNYNMMIFSLVTLAAFQPQSYYPLTES